MQVSRLKSLFVYVGLTYSTEEEDLLLLKRTLLLELKANQDKPIEIDGLTWSKNDVLQFFENKPDQWFDLEAFKLKYPWLADVYQPEKIGYKPQLQKIHFSDPEFVTFRNSESRGLEQEFTRCLREMMAAQEDYQVAAMLLYLPLFESDFHMNTLKWVKDQLMYRLNNFILSIPTNVRATNNRNAKFLRMKGYYVLISDHYTQDADLMDKNLEVISEMANKIDVHLLKPAIRFQLDLPHSDAGILYLKNLIRQINKILDKQHTSEERSSGVGRVIWIGVVIVVMLFRVGRSCSRSSEFDYSNSDAIQQWQNMQPQIDSIYYNGKKYERDSLTNKIIEEYHSGESVPPESAIPETVPPAQADTSSMNSL